MTKDKIFSFLFRDFLKGKNRSLGILTLPQAFPDLPATMGLSNKGQNWAGQLRACPGFSLDQHPNAIHENLCTSMCSYLLYTRPTQIFFFKNLKIHHYWRKYVKRVTDAFHVRKHLLSVLTKPWPSLFVFRANAEWVRVSIAARSSSCIRSCWLLRNSSSVCALLSTSST